MDNILKTNRERWNSLALANVEYSKPFFEFTGEQAAQHVYRHGIIQDVSGKMVLCLASGGGQDSVAFGLLGADVTVLDLSDIQLERDRLASAHHNLHTKTIQGDMSDLSIFPDDHFDIVWQVYSINFIPSVQVVFQEVHRVLKPGGIYFLQFANPFAIGIDEEKWDGKSYPLNALYLEGEDISEHFPHWDVEQPDGTSIQCDSPHEFRHTLGAIFNTMVVNHFTLLGLWEWSREEKNPEPGSWAHYTQVSPPWFSTFWRLQK